MSLLLAFFALLWIAFAVAVAVAARQRQRSAVIYFLCSLLFSPVLAIILLAISGGLRATKPAFPVRVKAPSEPEPILPRATAVTVRPPWERGP